MSPEQRQTKSSSTDPESVKRTKRLKRTLTIVIVLLLFWLSALDIAKSAGVSTLSLLPMVFTGFPEIWSLLTEMVPPDWGYFGNVVSAVLDTVRMGLLGATFGGILSIPLVLLSARNISKSPYIYQTFRFILNLIRTMPDLLLGAIFVAIFGLGLIPGILALTVFALGIIAKLAYEMVETIDNGPLEAMTAVGANKIQWIFFGVIPQILAQYVAYFLFTFEMNVRAAAILGIVGAGGIGLYYDSTLGLLQYQKTSVLIIMTLIVVLLIDFVTTKIREHLL